MSAKSKSDVKQTKVNAPGPERNVAFSLAAQRGLGGVRGGGSGGGRPSNYLNSAALFTRLARSTAAGQVTRLVGRVRCALDQRPAAQIRSARLESIMGARQARLGERTSELQNLIDFLALVFAPSALPIGPHFSLAPLEQVNPSQRARRHGQWSVLPRSVLICVPADLSHPPGRPTWVASRRPPD